MHNGTRQMRNVCDHFAVIVDQDGHGRGMDPGTRWFPIAMRPNSHASMVAYPSRSPSLSPEVGAGDGPR